MLRELAIMVKAEFQAARDSRRLLTFVKDREKEADTA
jgi:hypothetical protein